MWGFLLHNCNYVFNWSVLNCMLQWFISCTIFSHIFCFFELRSSVCFNFVWLLQKTILALVFMMSIECELDIETFSEIVSRLNVPLTTAQCMGLVANQLTSTEFLPKTMALRANLAALINWTYELYVIQSNFSHTEFKLLPGALFHDYKIFIIFLWFKLHGMQWELLW